MFLTNEEIDNIITCQKIITKPPKRQMQESGYNLRNDFELTSADNKHHFNVFIRQNTELPDNFSIGLIWKNTDIGKNIIMFRCNGPHGGNLKISEHFKPHTHTITTHDILNEIYKPTANGTKETNEYHTFDEALAHFCLYCGIQNAQTFFPSIISQSLFSDI